MVIAPAVIDLSVILLFCVALGLALLSKQVVKALFAIGTGLIGHIPWLGGFVTGPLHSIEQRLTNALGSAAQGLEARIGTLFHSLARLFEEAWSKTAEAFQLIYAVATLLDSLASWKGVLALYQSLVGKDRATVTNIREAGKTAAQAKARADHAAKTASQAVARSQAIPADVVLPGDLAGLRERVKATEDAIGRLWERTKALGVGAAGGVAVGALALALGKLGIGWGRCSNVNKVGKTLCGVNPDLLDSLLAGTALVLGSISIVELAKACQEITGACEDGVSFFVREVS